MLQLFAFVLPLGLDAFAIAAALGARRPSRAQRWRLSGVFVLFEAGMPLAGLALGVPIAHLIGSAADYIAAAALIAVGAWMLRGALLHGRLGALLGALLGRLPGRLLGGLPGGLPGRLPGGLLGGLLSDDDDEEQAGRMVSATGWALIALGFGISLDELAVGFTIGLAGLPVVAVIIAIAVQTLLATQLGLALGRRLGEAWRERAEHLAGAALLLLGVVLLVLRLTGRSA